MYTFTHLGKFGRLGNQLFQIATVISTAIDNNTEYYFNGWAYNEYLENKLPIGKNIAYKSYTEKTFHYTEIKKSNKNIDFRGWFQSWKYFNANSEAIRWHFKLNEKYDTYINSKYSDILTNNTCSIHVRRGDFLKLPEYHTVLPVDHYKKAITTLYPYGTNDITFIVASDDILWCKNNIGNLVENVIYLDEVDIIDMFIMSKCDNNIISCSSFSWWAAWLNDKSDKKIIASTKWFGHKYINKNTDDLIPDSWIKI